MNTAAGVPADPYKAQLRSTWDGLGPAWRCWQEFFERGTGPVTEWMLSKARIGVGNSVLDIATGAGEPALTVSDLVGPAGRVVGIDQSPGMLQAARSRAGHRKNTTFLVADLDQLSGQAGAGYDAVLCRFGLMFAKDLPKSLAGLAAVLKGGGWCTIAAWSQPARVPVISLAFGIAAAKLELPQPPPGMPGPFSMAEPGPVVEAMKAAGFVDVEAEEVPVTFIASSAAEFIDYSKATLPGWLASQIAQRFGTAKDNPVWTEVARSIAPYTQPDGRLMIPSVAVCFAGARS